jgi:uncharacterized membrane protein (DUF373 family)
MGERQVRGWISRGYTLIEDVVYVGLSLLLAVTVLALLGLTFAALARDLWTGSLASGIVALLEDLLLVLLLVELLYTVQVSFREHALVAEPFLLIGLISVIRRVIVLTAELGSRQQPPQGFVKELGVLGLLIMVLAGSLVLVGKKRH